MQPLHTETVLIANPSADVYGSDLQMVESAAGLRERGWRVVVVLPGPGPLVERLLAVGAEVEVADFPVLRRAAATPRGTAALGGSVLRALPSLVRLIARQRPRAVYVNTITLPWWLLAARLAGTPALCHVHEAEAADPPHVRRVLASPLVLARTVVVNSRSTEEVVLGSLPRLATRMRLVPNGVAGPDAPLAGPPGWSGRRPWRLAVVGRLSERKAPDTALEAVSLLRRRGHPVELALHGTPGPGQEPYVARLRARAAEPDLCGAVGFSGYADPVWPALEDTDLLLAPSLGESFGNAVVEGQLAGRPVVATAVQGHCETVEDGETGRLVRPRDPEAMADVVEELLQDAEAAGRMAATARRRALERFGSARYRGDIVAAVEATAAAGRAQARSASRAR